MWWICPASSVRPNFRTRTRPLRLMARWTRWKESCGVLREETTFLSFLTSLGPLTFYPNSQLTCPTIPSSCRHGRPIQKEQKSKPFSSLPALLVNAPPLQLPSPQLQEHHHDSSPRKPLPKKTPTRTVSRAAKKSPKPLITKTTGTILIHPCTSAAHRAGIMRQEVASLAALPRRISQYRRSLPSTMVYM